MRHLGICATVALALAAWVGSAVPAFGAESGTVNARVTVASPCITVTPSTTIDFGTLRFSTSDSGDLSLSSSKTIGYANCAAASEEVLVNGTDAVAEGAAWTPVGDGTGVCSAPDRYKLIVSGPQSTPRVALTTTGQLLETLAEGATGAANRALLVMPCSGSSGAGQTLSMQLIFTATF